MRRGALSRVAMEGGVRSLPPGVQVEVPAGFACFPDPLHPWPPRGFAEKGFNVSRYNPRATG
ncbi:hypothetical protein RQ734_16180 [Roseomonas mucosa]|uniref:hypothetical protein n=1 Tax=Roseomonas mucosa TaxID=207340 RepID=UPI0028CF66BB|nr:hypothetical protein [Roseomonas mucosa]MDT8277611.1 hypothetical protein [Roseomonas mucosa]MDT8354370.1 hypothetical protein [Roseomonas mucosa]